MSSRERKLEVKLSKDGRRKDSNNQIQPQFQWPRRAVQTLQHMGCTLDPNTISSHPVAGTTPKTEFKLDLKELERLLKVGMPKIEKAKGKKITLILGNTGSGKSALTNYLLKYPMKGKWLNGKYVIDVDDTFKAQQSKGSEKKTYAEVSHNSTDPHTLHPETFDLSSSLSICDCPGFEDRRNIEKRIMTTIGPEMVVDLADRIESVIVVIKSSEFDAVRAGGFINLMDTLTRLFKNTAEIANSLFFVITADSASDVPPDPKTATKRFFERIDAIYMQEMLKIQKFRTAMRMRSVIGTTVTTGRTTARTSNESSDSEEAYAISKKIEIMGLMRANRRNLLFINPLDSGQCRQHILTWLHSPSRVVIDKSAFNFSEYNKDRKLFDGLMIEVAAKSLALLKRRDRLIKHIYAEEARIAYTMRVEPLNEEALKLQRIEEALKAMEEDHGIALLEEEEITTLKKVIEKLTLRIQALKNNKTPSPFLKDSVNESRYWFWPFGWTKKVFDFSYPKVPFSSCNPTQQNGAFSDKQENLTKGQYHIVYKSDFYKTGIAEVVIYVEERHKPETQGLISSLEQELKDCEDALTHKRALAKLGVEQSFQALQKSKEELAALEHSINQDPMIEVVAKITGIIKFSQALILEFQALMQERSVVAIDTKINDEIRIIQAKKTTYQLRVQQHLHNAIKESRKELALGCLQLLLKINAKTVCWAISEEGNQEHALHLLAAYGRNAWLKEFLDYIPLISQNQIGATALHVAAKNDRLDFCLDLIKRGILYNKESGKFAWPKDKLGRTPFHHAAMEGQLALIAHFRSSEGNILRGLDDNGDNIIHFMVRKGHVNALTQFFAVEDTLAPALMRLQNKKGHDPVMEAVLSGDQAILDLMLKQQFDMNLRDTFRRTALHLAAEQDNLDAVKKLLHKGYSLQAQDSQELTPIRYAPPDSRVDVYFSNMMQSNYSSNHLVVSPLKYRNLVFQGGSVRVLGYPPALRQLVQDKLVVLDNIDTVVGTSAGAIMALALGVGFSLDEIDHLMGLQNNDSLTNSGLEAINFRKLLSGSVVEKLMAVKNYDWKTDADTFERLKQDHGTVVSLMRLLAARVLDGNLRLSVLTELKNVLKVAYGALNKDFGLCDGKLLRDTLDHLISYQYKKVSRKSVSNLTFKELSAYGIFKKMVFVGINLDTGEEEIFSLETTPDAVVSDTARISGSIPFLFHPHRLAIKDKYGQISYSQSLYMDAGVTGNYPIELCDRQTSAPNTTIPKINHETLGLRLLSKDLIDRYEKLAKFPIDPKKSSGASLWNYLQSVISAMSFTNVQENGYARQKNDFRTVYIDTGDLGMLDFDKADLPVTKQKMIQQGKEAAIRFKERREKLKKEMAVNFKLPQALNQMLLKYSISEQIVVEGEDQNSARFQNFFQIKRNCPELVLAFYEYADPNLHRYLHQILGVSIYASDDEGNTAFHLGAMSRRLDAYNRMLKVAADGDVIQNNSGMTASKLLLLPSVAKTSATQASTSTQSQSGGNQSVLWKFLGLGGTGGSEETKEVKESKETKETKERRESASNKSGQSQGGSGSVKNDLRRRLPSSL